MNIKHYMTVDAGSGPVSFVELTDADGRTMVRVQHRARFDRSKKVDPDELKAMIGRMASLGDASASVREELAEGLAEEVLIWMTANLPRQAVPQALRWLQDGAALAFRTDAEAREYDQRQGVPEATTAAPRRRRIMG